MKEGFLGDTYNQNYGNDISFHHSEMDLIEIQLTIRNGFSNNRFRSADATYSELAIV
jgi:hypothetical protein